jgi:hypothetical protein
MTINRGKMTLEEHKQLGKFMRIAQDKLCGESCKIKPKTKSHNSHENKAYELICKLKDHLEEIMWQDYPQLGNEEGINIYYGNAGREE